MDLFLSFCLLWFIIIFPILGLILSMLHHTTHTEGGKPKYTGKQNANIGLNHLAASIADPGAMAEAMEMLKDPATAREVGI